MPRDAITKVDLAMNAGKTNGSAKAINTTNGAYIATPVTSKIVLEVTNSHAENEYDVTIKAGDNPPAFRAGLGDLVVAIPKTETRYMVLETARFMQADGTIEVDFETGMTGGCRAFVLPAEV